MLYLRVVAALEGDREADGGGKHTEHGAARLSGHEGVADAARLGEGLASADRGEGEVGGRDGSSAGGENKRQRAPMNC